MKSKDIVDIKNDAELSIKALHDMARWHSSNPDPNSPVSPYGYISADLDKYSTILKLCVEVDRLILQIKEQEQVIKYRDESLSELRNTIKTLRERHDDWS